MTMKTARLYLLVLILFSSLVMGAAVAQQKPPKPSDQDSPLRLKADLIEIRAVVTDRQGKLIDNLKKEDFELTESGRPQDISFFTIERVGVKASDADKADKTEPARVSPASARDTAIPSRSVVLFLDTLHINAGNLMRVRKALRRYVDEQMTDRDVAAIVTVDGRLGALEQFTRDRKVLHLAIDRLYARQSGAQRSLLSPYLASLAAQGIRSAIAHAGRILSMEEGRQLMIREDEIGSPDNPKLINEKSDMLYVMNRAEQVLAEAAHQRRATLSTLKAVAERMSEMPGQRVIALFSEGFSLKERGASLDTIDTQTVIGRAVRSGVLIYSIDVGGLEPPGIFDASVPGFGGGSGVFASTLDASFSSYMSASKLDQQQGLNALAEDTGGEAIFNTNDLAAALGKALDSSRAYYVLAYYPQNEKETRQFRRVSVRVKNHPEYVVRAQKGYLPLESKKAEAAKTPAEELMQAMLAPLPLRNIEVSATAEYLESEVDNAQVSLYVHIAGNALEYREQDKRHGFDLEVGTAIYDESGKAASNVGEKVQGTLSAERFALARQTGFRYAKRFALKPGLYQIRVGVREPATRRIGTAIAWIEVPNLNRKKLALSSIFLREDMNKDSQPLDAGKALASRQGLFKGVKTYKNGEALVYLFEVYNAALTSQNAGGPVMQLEIIHRDVAIYQSGWQAVASRAVGSDKKGIQVGGQLGLSKMTPGLYELRVTVKEAKAKRGPQQSVMFEVLP